MLPVRKGLETNHCCLIPRVWPGNPAQNSPGRGSGKPQQTEAQSLKSGSSRNLGYLQKDGIFFPALTSDLPCSGRAPAPCGDRAWSCGRCWAHTGPKINGIFPVWCPRDAGTSRILHFFCSKFTLEIKEFALSDIWVALLAWHKWPLLALNPQPEGFDPCGIKTMEFPSFWHFWTN